MRAFEPRVARHPAMPERLVAVSEQWNEAGQRWIYAYASHEGGATWSRTRLPGGPGAPPTDPLAACTSAFDPIVALLPDGTVLAGGVAGNMLGVAFHRELFLARSTDGGKTFPETAVVTLGGSDAVSCTPAPGGSATGKFVDKPYVAAGPDGGAFASWWTWSDALSLDAPDHAGWIVPTLALDEAGVAYSGYYHHLDDRRTEYRVAAHDGAHQAGPLVVSRGPIGHQSLGLDPGHYMGMVGLPEGTFAVWVSGEPPSPTTAGPQTADLRGARVESATPS